MSINDKFTADPVGFAGKYSILVNEANVPGPVQAQIAGLAGAGPHILTTANYLLSVKFEAYGPNQALCEIHPAAAAGCLPCYFLPYRADTAIAMTLAGGADYFFTSTLTGCSVRAEGPPATPRVTHSNARSTYQQHFANEKKIQHADDTNVDDLKSCESMATYWTQGTVNAMFPAGMGGGPAGTVTKQTYLDKLTRSNLRKAKRNFRTKKWHHTIGEFEVSTYAGYKPEIGGFVFGVRSPLAGWSFYLQSSVGVTGTRNTGFLGIKSKAKPLVSESVVLGSPQRFYP